MRHPYYGITIALGSMHQKERVIEPPLRQTLNISLVPVVFNTDAFGTFTGETHRHGTMLDAARAKAMRAIEIRGASYGLASEGSFSPHPHFPWVIVDRELLLFVDRERNLEISALVTTTDVQAHRHEVQTLSEALVAAQASKIPEHGLTLRHANRPTWVAKGLRDEAAITEAFTQLRAKHPDAPLVLETDLRAHMNPSRQRAIAKAAESLTENLVRLCPRCDMPGFSLVARLPGAPCIQCDRPTSLVGSEQFHCSNPRCRHEQIHRLDIYADPGNCLFCNP